MNAPSDTSVVRTHAVFFSDANEAAVARLNGAYSSVYQLSETLFLVKTSDLASRVAERVGIKGSDRLVPGVVLKLNDAYSGYFKGDLWDWLG